MIRAFPAARCDHRQGKGLSKAAKRDQEKKGRNIIAGA
jgi:hypothetical protein